MDDDMKIVGRSGEIKMNRRLKLGRGSFGSVYRGHHKTHGSCAVKRIEIDEKNELASKNFSKELDIIKSSRHPNMVRYLFDDEDDNFYYIAMELCTSSLSDYFKKHGYDAFEDDMLVTRIMYQCTSGVDYLHGKHIMHKDIKPANMLLSENLGLVTIKLADFGMCKVLNPSKSSTVSSAKGSLGYNAPEVVLRLRNKCQSDIFSLGIAFHEFSTRGAHPFSGNDKSEAELVSEMDRNAISGKVRLQAELNITKKKEPNLSAVAKKPFGLLISKMLNHNWQLRPDAAQVLASLKEVAGNDDRMGEPIERSVLFAENNATSNENRVSLKKSAGNAQRLLKDAATEQNLILAAASPSQQIVTLYDERSPLPAKRRKIGVEENNEYYQAPKTTPKPAFLEPIKNAHLSIRRGKWNKAKENLNCALQLLEPMVSVKAQSLYECARTASTKSHYVVSILLYVCSASQFRKEMIPTDGSFKTSNCIFKICEATMQALKATNSEELTRSNVRFNDIAERFVIPLVTNEYEKLKQFGKAKNIMRVAAVQHSAFAGSWFAVLLNFLGSAEKAAEIAEEARKQLEQCSPGSYQTHARLLHEEGKASIQLKKHDDARDLLNNSLKIANTYDSQSVLYIRKSIEDNELKQAATQQHSSLNYQPNCEDLVKF